MVEVGQRRTVSEKRFKKERNGRIDPVIAAERSRASYCYVLTLGLGDPSSQPGKGRRTKHTPCCLCMLVAEDHGCSDISDIINISFRMKGYNNTDV